MSGIELTGVIVSVIPLLVATLERSARIVGRGKTSQTKKLQELKAMAEAELTAYQTVIETVLQEVFQSEPATAMLEGLDPKIWSDVNFRNHFRAALGNHADEFDALCLALDQKLTSINRDLDQIVWDIGQESDDGLLFKREPHEKSRIIRNAELLRHILPTDNAANLKIGIYASVGTIGSQTSIFKVLFKHKNSHAANASGWAIATVTVSPSTDLLVPKRKSDTVHNSESQTNQNRVRFVYTTDSRQDSDPNLTSGTETVLVDNVDGFHRHFIEIIHSPELRYSVCLRHPLPHFSVKVKFRGLENTHMVNLRQLLELKTGISKFARLALVVELARAVSLFCQANVLHGTLGSGNIWFTKTSNQVILGNLVLFIGEPSVQHTNKHYQWVANTILTASEQQHPPSWSPLYDLNDGPNNLETNFSRLSLMLGITFVEILLMMNLSPQNEEDVNLSPRTLESASGALDALYSEWGLPCYAAVRQCLVGHNFLTTTEQEEVFFRECVLKPLEDVLLNFDSGVSGTSAKVVLVKDWDQALSGSQEISFPTLTDDWIRITSETGDSTAFEVLKDYVCSMRISCERVSWLDQALSKEVRDLDDALRQLDHISQSIASDNPHMERIEELIRVCIGGIRTIPQIHDLEAQNHPYDKALEDLQLQLRLDTLELMGQLADLQANRTTYNSSPSLSSTYTAFDEISIFDKGRSTLSSRSSVAGNIDIDHQPMDSRAVAGEIFRSLCLILELTPFSMRQKKVDAPNFTSNMRQTLHSYVTELASLPEASQSPSYQRAHSMVLKEFDFLLQQLCFICQQKHDLVEVSMPPKAVANTHIKVDTIPAFVVTDFLMGGKAFGRLRLRIRRLVQQDTMQIISDEVRQNLPLTGPGLYNAIFHVRWDISDYIEIELDGSTDIGHVLVLTGGSSNAYASRCAEYLKWLWSNSKYDICSHLQQYLEEKEYEHSDATLMIRRHAEGQNGITVNVVGAKETIITVAQQLAWLTAAFRSCSNGVALSEVDFISMEGMQFFIEPGPLMNLAADTVEVDTCWHRLVRNAAVAHGFPIPPRSNQVGLEIPFSAMLKLSQTSSFLVGKQHIAFYGFSSLLFPLDQRPDDTNHEVQDKQSIQWHFETTDEPDQYFDCADYLAESKCAWAKGVDQRNLMTSRHFVGYCRVAEICLATKDSNFMNLKESPLDEASTMAGARIENITTGTGGLGFVTGEVEINIRYPHNIVRAVAPDEYLGILDTFKTMSMILRDYEDQCGWLVPAQALLLHMAHLWVQSKGIKINLSHEEQGDTYLDKVDKILRDDRKTVLRKEGRDDDSDFQLRHLIIRFWTDIRGCMIEQQSAIRDDKGVIGYQSGAISGWELFDFITRPPLEFSMKQDKRGSSPNSWEALAKEKNIPVLFCQGAGDIIKTTNPNNLCANCKLPLRQECQLVASLACLGYMAKKYGGFRTRTKLTTKWGWHPSNEVALFREDCRPDAGTRCHGRLQELITVKDEQQGTDLALPLTGAVVFGKHPPHSTLAVTTTDTTSSAKKRRNGKLYKWWNKLKK